MPSISNSHLLQDDQIKRSDEGMAYPLLPPEEGMQQEQCMPGTMVFEAIASTPGWLVEHLLTIPCPSTLLLLLASLRSQHKKLVEGTTELLKQWELVALPSFQLLQPTAPVTKPSSSLVGRSKVWAKEEGAKAEASGLGLTGSTGASDTRESFADCWQAICLLHAVRNLLLNSHAGWC